MSLPISLTSKRFNYLLKRIYFNLKVICNVVCMQVATRIMQFLIDNFGVSNLFGRHNYEFYARITGRILKVEEDWIFSFRYPPDTLVSRKYYNILSICSGGGIVRSISLYLSLSPYPLLCYRAAIS
jgi:hypothetical protein